ncbi:hypothetical protein PG994_006024 [Apiospora phragmitis]|uniref:Uncharacterized protein n=1 Tax=Apiospora phragmitis TaxID=2905665 RepID=A0ABR1VHN1_9PEZI
MSVSLHPNPGLCWKCQALLNEQYPASLRVHATSSGCALCLRLLHSFSILERDLLQQGLEGPDNGTSAPDIEYMHFVELDEQPPNLILLKILGKGNSSKVLSNIIILSPESQKLQHSQIKKFAVVRTLTPAGLWWGTGWIGLTSRLGKGVIIDGRGLFQLALQYRCNPCSVDGTYGCFIERDPQLVKPLKVEVNWGPSPGSYCITPDNHWEKNVLETPLNSRAWVCQERYLAPRNLSFGETQICWECCDCPATETFPVGLPPDVRRKAKSLDPHTSGAALRREYELSDVPSLNGFSLWLEIVRQYSKGQLTYSEDKLVAISGLASRMHKHIQTGYLAGLWRKHLAYQLLWMAGDFSGPRYAVYTAPSWSWASFSGTIYDQGFVFHADDNDIIPEIQEAQTQLVSDMIPFGKVKGGYIKARGYLVGAGVHFQDSQYGLELFLDNKKVGRVSIDGHEHGAAPRPHHGLYYLPIRYYYKSRDGSEEGAMEVQGLICQATSPGPGTEFVRVGWFEINEATEKFQALCREHSTGSQQAGTTEDTKEWGPKLEFTLV